MIISNSVSNNSCTVLLVLNERRDCWTVSNSRLNLS